LSLSSRSLLCSDEDEADDNGHQAGAKKPKLTNMESGRDGRLPS